MHAYIGTFRTGAYACSLACADVPNVITLLLLPHICCTTICMKMYISISIFNVRNEGKFTKCSVHSKTKQHAIISNSKQRFVFLPNIRHSIRICDLDTDACTMHILMFSVSIGVHHQYIMDSTELCTYYINFERDVKNARLKYVHDVNCIQLLQKAHHQCPY